MHRRNLFDGDSYKAEFAIISYRMLMSRRWISMADIMAERLGVPKDKLPANLSNCDGYGELKKTVSVLRKAIAEKLGVCAFEEDGNNRNKRFRYVGKDDDPLADMKNARVINDLRQYWKFCQDSSGFFPISWLEYFFKDCQDLLDIKEKRHKGEEIISSGIDRILTNIEYLPSLYVAISNKQVLEIDYKPYDEEMVTLLFHPHFLKEYNGRWHLFGHADGREPEYGYNIALDRIMSRPHEKYKVDYIAAPKGFYEDFFKDIVGVSHINGSRKEHVVIRTHSIYMYKLMDTKPLHASYVLQKPYGKYIDGDYAEFSVDVEVNNEFIGRVLQMGAGLEIIAPDNIRELFKNRVNDIADLYVKR